MIRPSHLVLISRVYLSQAKQPSVFTMTRYNPTAARMPFKHLPMPTGKYPVGCVDIMTEHSREGTFVRLYYPTKDATMEELSCSWPDWIPSKEYMEGYGKMWKPWSNFFQFTYEWIVGPVKVPAAVGAPVRPSGHHRAIVFSHGLGGCRTTYSVTCTELASRGFVVAAVEHRDGTACITYHLKKEGKEGRVKMEWVPFKIIPPSQRQYPIRNEQVNQRVAECQSALELLHKLNEGEKVGNVLSEFMDLKQFEGRLNLTRPIMMGHSFGGAATIRACAMDNRFQYIFCSYFDVFGLTECNFSSAGVVLDCWMFPLKEDKNVPPTITQPLLFINMESFQTKTNLSVMKWFEGPYRKVLTLRGTDHANQTDVPFLSGYRIVKWLLRSSTKMDAHLSKDLSNALAINFIQKTLGDHLHIDLQQIIDDNRGDIIEGISLPENHL